MRSCRSTRRSPGRTRSWPSPASISPASTASAPRAGTCGSATPRRAGRASPRAWTRVCWQPSAPASHGPAGRPRVLGTALLALSLAAAGLLVERYREVRLRIDGLGAAQALLPAERRAGPHKSLDEEVKNAEAVARQLALPWAAMIHAVEG